MAEWVDLIGHIVWPTVLLIFLALIRKPLIRIADKLAELVEHRDVELEVGGQRISLKQITTTNGANITDLQERIARIENINKIAPAKGPAESGSDVISGSILWIDDNPANNAFLIERFRQYGHQVDLSLSTKDALQKLEINSYNKIISDLGRKEDGVENPNAGIDFIREARSRNISTPILIFTSSRGKRNKSKILEAGANIVTTSGVDVISFVEGMT